MIYGLVGNLSGGKTVTVVREAYKWGSLGKKVISNIYLRFPEHINYEFMSNEDFIDFLIGNYMDTEAIKRQFYNSVLVLDETVNLISARKASSNLNELITNFLMMVGKLDCEVYYTAQIQESQIDLRLREITNCIGECFRLTSKGFIDPFDTESKRILNQKVWILILWKKNRGFLGVQVVPEIYDPELYFKLYNTREITLLDRQNYSKGGIKDVTQR